MYEALKAFGKWPQGSIVIAQQEDGQWRFTAATVAGIDRLHESMQPLPPRHMAPQAGDEEPELVGVLGATLTRTPLWGWLSLLGAIFAGLLIGKIAQSTLRKSAEKLDQRGWQVRATVMRDAASPLSFLILTIGLSVGMQFLYLDELAGFVERLLVFST